MYTWRQLAQRAGVSDGDPDGTGFEALPLSVYYGRPDQRPSVQEGIVVIPCTEDAWYNLLALPPNSLDWLPQNRVLPDGATLPFTDTIPVLFWGAGYEDGHKPFAERREDDTIIFYADIIAATFFMLTRWEETVVLDRDEHERFPSTASVAYKQGFLDRPLVDEYALILREWLKVLCPVWEPQSRKFSVKLSHDIDDIRHFSYPYRIGRALVVTLRKCRTLPQCVQHFSSLLRAPDPLASIYQLAELSEAYGLRSAFNFQAARSTVYDRGYALTSPLIQECIKVLRESGHEIGFHPGYHTFADSARFAQEKTRLERSLGHPVAGGRQHFLRFDVPDTWRIWEEAGLEYDSTLGFADYEGFRCGTCHPFNPFDLQQNRVMDLLELPLLVMDGSLYQYRSLTPEQGQAIILKLAQRCYQVGGTFTLLWHNTSLEGEWQPWFAMYQSVLPLLAAMQESTLAE